MWPNNMRGMAYWTGRHHALLQSGHIVQASAITEVQGVQVLALLQAGHILQCNTIAEV